MSYVTGGEHGNMADLRLVAADSEDLGYVEWLLREEGLPHEDVREDTATQFYLAMVDDEPIGAGGYEVCADAVLLRSVVVEPDERGAGYGRAVVEALLDRATPDATAAYLLTTSAEEFFADLGFERVERDRAPPEIRETAQFSEHCPSSATCMKRDLPAS